MVSLYHKRFVVFYFLCTKWGSLHYRGVFYIQKRADHNSRLLICERSLHHHRLLAAVRKGKLKPSVVVNGDALNGGGEAAVLPFGVKEVNLSEFKEKTAKNICALYSFSALCLVRAV